MISASEILHRSLLQLRAGRSWHAPSDDGNSAEFIRARHALSDLRHHFGVEHAIMQSISGAIMLSGWSGLTAATISKHCALLTHRAEQRVAFVHSDFTKSGADCSGTPRHSEA